MNLHRIETLARLAHEVEALEQAPALESPAVCIGMSRLQQVARSGGLLGEERAHLAVCRVCPRRLAAFEELEPIAALEGPNPVRFSARQPISRTGTKACSTLRLRCHSSLMK